MRNTTSDGHPASCYLKYYSARGGSWFNTTRAQRLSRAWLRGLHCCRPPLSPPLSYRSGTRQDHRGGQRARRSLSERQRVRGLRVERGGAAPGALREPGRRGTQAHNYLKFPVATAPCFLPTPAAASTHWRLLATTHHRNFHRACRLPMARVRFRSATSRRRCDAETGRQLPHVSHSVCLPCPPTPPCPRPR